MTAPTIYWFDGLDGYTGASQFAATRPEIYNIEDVISTAGRFGGGAIRNFSLRDILTLPSVYSEVWLSRAMLTLSGASGEITIGEVIGSDNSSVLFTLNMSTGVITAYTSSFTPAGQPIAGASASVWTPLVWHWVEIRVRASPSALNGIVEVWLDDACVLNAPVVYTTSANIDRCSISIRNAYCRVDDPVVSDSQLGDSRAVMQLPASDASPNDGVPDSGTAHYARVNETPGWDGDTSYDRLTGGSAKKEAFGLTSLPATATTIYAVETMTAACKEDVGAGVAHASMKSGSTTHDGASHGLSTSYSGWRDRMDTDPNTGSMWTPSALNAAKLIYTAE